MSAFVPCGSCCYKWDGEEDFGPCSYCKNDYDPEQEMYHEFSNYAPAINADALAHMAQMESYLELPKFLCLLSAEMQKGHTPSAWREWLHKRYCDD